MLFVVKLWQQIVRWAGPACAAVVLCLAMRPASSAETFSFPEPAPAEVSRTLKIWGTVYFVYRARSSSRPDAVPVLDSNDQPLGVSLSRWDWCNAALEGTVQVMIPGGSRVFNYARSSSRVHVDCSEILGFLDPASRKQIERTVFMETTATAPGGLGGRPGTRLVPYRTLAVDPRFIPMGSLLYIPSLRGLRMPDGQVHDGYVLAEDTGIGIAGNHVDLFIGASGNPYPGAFNARPDKPLTAYLVDSKSIAERLAAEHRLSGTQ